MHNRGQKGVLCGLAAFVLVVSSVGLQASPKRRYVYTVQGQVVDKNHQPVAGTTISMKSPKAYEGDIVYTETSDAGGYFRIQRIEERPISQWTLYISDYSSLPNRAHRPLDFHVGTVLSKRCCQSLRGQKIYLRAGTVLNLGKIKVNDKQWPLEVKLRYPNGTTFREPSWLTIRDKYGDIVCESGYRDDGFLGLPAGTWNLEIVDQEGPVFRGQKTITVIPKTTSNELTIPIEKIGAPIFSGRGSVSNQGRSEARKRLLSLGWKLTNSEFADRVAAGNYEAIELYLTAGFDPNVLTKNEDTVMTAISHPFILKSLLEAGADPNRKIRDGITPLLYACGWLIIPKGTVKMLLEAGADISAETKDGRDVFTLAEEREEILRLLEEHRNERNKKRN